MCGELADEDDEDGEGSDVADDEVDGPAKGGFEAAAVGHLVEDVGLFHFPADEEDDEESADRHEVGGGDVVEVVEEGTTVDVEEASLAEAEGGEDADEGGASGADNGGPGAGEAGLLGDGGDDDFEEGDGGGEGGDDEEEEEDEAEEVAAGHVLEDEGECGEGEGGAGFGADAEGEGGGEDDDAGEDGDEGVGKDYAGGRGGHVVLFADIGAVGDEGTHADGEGEEGLAHGTDEDAGGDFAEVGVEEELQPLFGTGEGEGVDAEDDHDGEEEWHEDF